MTPQKVIRVDLGNSRIDQPARGFILQLMPQIEELLGVIRDVHVVTLEPGIVRGNHYHQIATEILIPIAGDLELGWMEADQQCLEVAVPGQLGYLFLPGTPHALRNSGRVTAIAIAFGNRGFDPNDTDRYLCEIFPV